MRASFSMKHGGSDQPAVFMRGTYHLVTTDEGDRFPPVMRCT
jgi:hypothetical protein